MTELPFCGHSALMVLWIGIAITIAIFATMVYSIVSFCNSSTNNAARFTQHAYAEVIWAMIPIVILIITAMPSVKQLVAVDHGCGQIAAVAAR